MWQTEHHYRCGADAILLTTDRLLLREFEYDDWPAVLAYQSDPRYLRYYHWAHRTAEEVHEFVQTFRDASRAVPRTGFQLAIVLRENNRLIGNCGFRLPAPEAQQGEIGYEVDPRYWGHGYATEAARAMLAFGFKEGKVHRISANCVAENTGSARVLEKLGMQREGRLRENEWIKGRWHDTLLYAILDYEWRAG